MSDDYQKLDWQDVRKWVEKLNKPLFDIIDEINPKDPIYLLKYPYGVTISDDKYFYFPEGSGREPLDAKDWPYMFVFKKKAEIYLQYQNKIVPERVYSAGDFFPYSYEMTRYEGVRFRPSSVYKLKSGVRNVSLLPLVHKNESYERLRSNCKISKRLNPELQNDHFRIVRSISDFAQNDWRTEILIFDGGWKKKIFSDPDWFSFRNYIMEKAIRNNASRRNHFFLDHAIKDIITTQDLKLKPLSIEMIDHVLSMTLGEIPGMRPAIDDSGLPLSKIVRVFKEIYMPSSPSVLVEPHMYNLFKDNYPTYHSITASSKYLNEKKTFRPLFYLNEAHSHFNKFLKSFSKHPFTKKTIFGSLYNSIDVKCYSVMGDTNGIKGASKLVSYDERFSFLYNNHKTNGVYSFPNRSIFTKALFSVKIDSAKLVDELKK